MVVKGDGNRVKYGGQRDANHAHIRDRLRELHCSVADTGDVGDGFPDLVVGYRKMNFLFEIKDPDQIPSKRKLTPDQEKFHGGWRGQIHVIETLEQAIKIIGMAIAERDNEIWQPK